MRRDPENSRRDLLRALTAAFAAHTIGRRSSLAQTQRPGGRAREKLLASGYLGDDYIKAAQSLQRFDQLAGDGKADASEARAALNAARSAICDGLTKLADDSQFWTVLGEQRARAARNPAEIRRSLDDLDGFLRQEDKVLTSIPPGPRMKLISNLALAVARTREYPTSFNVEDLRNRVRETQAAVCIVDQSHSIWFYADVVADSLDVLGGGLTVVMNIVAAEAVVVTVGSVVGGVALLIHGSSGIVRKIKE